ncbi:MAG: hypothetical protein MI863_09785, partial [Desulfobacterales bacterium]|nr:hypothetical protein [Desulfobacterales bacterium]
MNQKEENDINFNSPVKTVNQDPAPKKRQYVALHPGRLTTALVLTVTLVLGLPVLWVHFTAPPEAASGISLLGIPYFDLVYVFLLSAVTLIVSTMVLVPLGTGSGLMLFIFSLFCAFPLVIGLRHHLEITQVLLSLEWFRTWPYFLHPAWLMSQVLFPAGILIFLFLYIRSLFYRKRHAMAFLTAVAMISGAAVLSGSEMARAG